MLERFERLLDWIEDYGSSLAILLMLVGGFMFIVAISIMVVGCTIMEVRGE